MIAADIMTENPRTVRPDDTIGEAIEVLQSMDVRHLPVVNEVDELLGILSDRDLGPLMGPFTEGEEADQTILTRNLRPVASLMHGDVVYVDPDALIDEVIGAMIDYRLGAIPVVDGDGRLAGIISYVDVLRAVSPWEMEPEIEVDIEPTGEADTERLTAR